MSRVHRRLLFSVVLIFAAVVVGFTVQNTAPAAATTKTDGENVKVRIPDTSGILLVDLEVNGAGENASGQYTGWRTTYNANNSISFTYSAPAGTTMVLTDQYGHVLKTWTIANDITNEEIAADFTLDDGIGDYTLTLTATNPAGQSRAATIKVKYLALDGSVPDPDVPDSGAPGVPGTGIRYVYVGGYALPTYWLVIIAAIITAGMCFFYCQKQQKKAPANGKTAKK